VLPPDNVTSQRSSHAKGTKAERVPTACDPRRSGFGMKIDGGEEDIDEATSSWMAGLRESCEDRQTFEDPLIFGSGFKSTRPQRQHQRQQQRQPPPKPASENRPTPDKPSSSGAERRQASAASPPGGGHGGYTSPPPPRGSYPRNDGGASKAQGGRRGSTIKTSNQKWGMKEYEAEFRRLHRATPKESRKKLFLALCLRWHPDKNMGKDVELATKVFQLLQDSKVWLLS
jgi:hypothetical protein